MNTGATPYQARTNRAGGMILCALVACAAWFIHHADDAEARGGPRLDRGERSLVREVNRIRAQHGLPRLRPQRALNRSADAHSRDMARSHFFGHASSNGRNWQARVRRYRPAHQLGENLAYLPAGQRRRQAATIVTMWLGSADHRAILLSPQFRRIGIGRRTGHVGGQRAAVYTADFASER